MLEHACSWFVCLVSETSDTHKSSFLASGLPTHDFQVHVVPAMCSASPVFPDCWQWKAVHILCEYGSCAFSITQGQVRVGFNTATFAKLQACILLCWLALMQVVKVLPSFVHFRFTSQGSHQHPDSVQTLFCAG